MIAAASRLSTTAAAIRPAFLPARAHFDEELNDVILVGHSFGGIPITGVAARMPTRIRSLVYLDAGVPDVGESAMSPLSVPVQEQLRQSVVKVNGVDALMPPNPLPAYWGLAGADAA